MRAFFGGSGVRDHGRPFAGRWSTVLSAPPGERGLTREGEPRSALYAPGFAAASLIVVAVFLMAAWVRRRYGRVAVDTALLAE